MYIPSQFSETRVEVLHELIRAHPFGVVVTLTDAGLEANHVPFVLEPSPQPLGTLRGHVARANPLWREFQPEIEALAIFQGPHAYVSPGWYPTKQETGKVVPTWNYAVVHARGPLRVVEDAGWLRDQIEALTDQQESVREEPWQVADAPADFIDRMMGAIVGIEIPVNSLVGKWKVSQNRPAKDREGVIDGLTEAGTDEAFAMARLVREAMR
jgi:transcriptional regulator